MGRRLDVPAGVPVLDGDDTGCTILHVDMDAFYASVEVRRNPDLRGKPVVVGGLGPRGVVSSASYEARAMGVRSAMPTSRARALCPRAIFLPPDMAEYQAVSHAVMQIFTDTTPWVEPLSVDEAFLDVAGARRLFGRPGEIATLIRTRVRDELGLTCSVGVAATKFIAKLASTRAKPDGLLIVPAQASVQFLHPLPVSALWGVGEKTAQVLHRLGMTTVADVAEAPIGTLRRALGEATATHLHELAWARDPRRVVTGQAEKSVSAETTFDTDVTDPDLIRRTLLGLSSRVARRLRRGGLSGRTIGLKVRLADFRTLTRARTLATPTDVSQNVFAVAWELFLALALRDQVRLVGVRVAGLTETDQVSRQPVLGERQHGWRAADVAADAVAAKFGTGAVRPASLLAKPTTGPPAQNQDISLQRD